MLGLNVKRGVATTLERVFNASGEEMGELEILWSGKTAGIIFDKRYGVTNAKVIFPSVDEKSDIPHTTFNNLIGYALHELGHAWYTDNKPWDRARNEFGSFVGALINGLEDPRIERCVIESGRAPNARALFENLVNSILTKDGYVEPDDKKNIPFLLAIEGRRMNGYDICADSIVDASPWKKDIKWALKRANKAKDTATIVKIAVELFKRLTEKEEEVGQGEDTNQPPQGEPQDGDGQDGQPQDGEPPQTQPTDDPADDDGQDGANGQDKGDPSDSDEQGEDDGSDGSDGDDTNGQDGDKPTDGNPTDGQDDDGQDGDPTDGDGQDDDGDDGDGQDGDPSDEPTDDKPSAGNGKSESLEGGREVEPSDFIEGELDKHSTSVDDKKSRPSYGKPEIATFSWR